MKTYFALALSLFLAGCIILPVPPSIVEFNGRDVGTYSTAAGCGTLTLDQDCSQITGPKRKLELDGIKIKVAGSEYGNIVFLSTGGVLFPDQQEIRRAARSVESYLRINGIEVISTRVMYGAGRVYGVRYRLDGDGYTLLRQLSEKQ